MSLTYSLQSFTIRHYASDVAYSTEGFIEKNRNFLLPDAIHLMRRSTHDIVQVGCTYIKYTRCRSIFHYLVCIDMNKKEKGM